MTKNHRALALAALSTLSAYADSSAVILHQRADPFDVTLLGESTQLTTAQTNLSLRLQKASDHSDVPDAKVSLRFTRDDNGKITEVMAPATHARASNKMLYGALVTLPAEGYWTFIADIDAQGAHVQAAAKLSVGPPEAPMNQKWPLIALVPVLILAFVLNRWLKRRFRIPYRPTRP